MSKSVLENYEIEHYNSVRKIAPECMVLLKSDGSFPIASNSKIALFGAGARHTYRGGTGGGIVESRPHTTVEQGLKKAGFDIVSDNWLNAYDEILERAKDAHRQNIKEQLNIAGLTGLGALSMAMPDPNYELPLAFSADAAVYVLTRVSGEGADRQDIKGDLRLSDTEIRDIRKCSKLYKKFMLVLNVGGIVDLSPIVENCPNILLLLQLGSAIGDAFADVLCGKNYPSGKLADTWAAIEDYQHFGDWVEQHDTKYKEGIYVGYRYFDAEGKIPLFPFGFGKSYTEFEITCGKATLDKCILSLPVTVKNVGIATGKEVVQCYVSLPNDNLDMPENVLCAFVKTNELKAGESEIVNISFDIREISTFDKTLCASILPKGQYIVNVGNSSRNLKAACVIELDALAVVKKLTHVGGESDFDDFVPVKKQRVIPNVQTLKISYKDIPNIERPKHKPSDEAVKFVDGLSDDEVLKFLTGSYEQKAFFDRNEYTAGQVGQTTYDFESRGVKSVSMADGPAGVHISGECGVDEKGIYPKVSEQTAETKKLLPEKILKYLLAVFPEAANENRGGEYYTQYCTAVPIETAIAQSFNKEVAKVCGDIFGSEAQRYNIDCHLAPALNIHRHPLCGRNFEYFSEDPYLSGVMAAEIVNAEQSYPRQASCLKHFVCNEQDTNRLYSNSIVSERALRDIYMKPFEIAIALSKPMAVMTSYNLLNGEHTSERKDLIETTLRGEFGFNGVVMSDWVGFTEPHDKGKHRRARCIETVSAGNDLMMPGNEGYYNELAEGLKNGELTAKQARQCAIRVVDFALKIAK